MSFDHLSSHCERKATVISDNVFEIHFFQHHAHNLNKHKRSLPVEDFEKGAVGDLLLQRQCEGL